MDRATYTLSPDIVSPGQVSAGKVSAGLAGTQPRMRAGGGAPAMAASPLAPWRRAGGFILAGWLWLVASQAGLDTLLQTGLTDADAHRRLMVLRLLPLAVAGFVIAGRSLAARARAESRLHGITAAMPQLCAVLDPEGTIQYANPEFLRRLSSSWTPRTAMRLETLLAPALLSAQDGALLPPRGEAIVDVGLKGHDGISRKSGIRICRIDRPEADLGWIVTSAGAGETQERHADHTLKSLVVETAMDAVAIAEIRGTDMPLIYVNPAFQDLTGYPAADVLGRNLRFLQGSDRMQPEIAIIRDCIAKLRPVVVTLRNYHRNGTMFWNQLRLSVAYDGSGRASHYIGVMRDVTELTQNAQQLARLTHFDQVTASFNRAHFTEMLGALLTRLDGRVLLMTLDVKRLDNIIRCFGEATGDALLKAVAARLRGLPGQPRTDAPLVGRLGDNAFGVAIERQADADAEPAVAALRAALRDPFRLPDGDVELQFSVGAVIGRSGMHAAMMVHRGLAALSQSTQADGGATLTFDTTSEEDIRRRVGLSRDLDHAIGSGAFALHLQPAIALEDGRWVGAEALVRWRHPVFGLQSPDLFLSVSEETGQILKIDAWALRNAAGLVRRLNESGLNQTGHTPLAVSVNLSSLRLQRHDLVAMLGEILRDTGADPSMLKLEIAERVLAGGYADIIGDLEQLRAIGFGIVVDNFGSGASNLLNLNRLPVSEIKIDRNFVRGCESCAYRQTVIGSFVAIGRTLGIDVTATGVESDIQRQALERLGVRRAQGFLFGAPVDAAAFIALADTRSHQSATPMPRPWSGAASAAQGFAARGG
jgi:PAS domain S-box-containing protein